MELSYAIDEQLAKSFRRFYKEATDADAASFVASVRAKATRVTMSQLQEHFVQHRTSTMAEATTDIRLGESAMDASGSGYGEAHSFYS